MEIMIVSENDVNLDSFSLDIQCEDVGDIY